MSVLISGVLIDPSGTAISGAEITFTALTNGNSVLNGFSVSATTNEEGEYAIPLELCDYSISIQHDGNNAIYGSVSINKDTTPTTINDLLEKARQEQTVTPQIIVYFREIQADVTQKLVTMQSLSAETKSAADSAATSNAQAQAQAQKAQQASELSQQAGASALTSANEASASKAAAETAATNALSSANAAGTAKGAAESAANQAEQSKLAAVSAADSAQNAKTSAGDSATQAANSANNANASAASASQAASSASNSASSAAGSASAAQHSAAQAEAWAKTVDTSSFARKGANSDITSLTGLRTALSVAQGGTGATTAAAARAALGLGNAAAMNTGTTAGTVAAGDDIRLNTINGKSGGTITGKIVSNTTDWAFEKSASGLYTVSGEMGNSIWICHGQQNIDAIVYGQYYTDPGGTTGYRLVHSRSDQSARVWFFRHDGAAVGLNWISTSDGRLKDNKEEITDAISKISSLKGMTYVIQGTRRAGLIAQDVEAVLPEAVVNAGTATAIDGTTIENSLALDYNAVTALLVNAVKEQQQTIKEQQQTIDALLTRVAALESQQN
ncbi:tail fiber domain-containing protein [Dickeya chrysanthemi]|uniref:tail fiber domain-containing protein n=1 Tax=Dickeya chrysanthemi TaxID=556 RepID=UPI0030199B7B